MCSLRWSSAKGVVIWPFACEDFQTYSRYIDKMLCNDALFYSHKYNTLHSFTAVRHHLDLDALHPGPVLGGPKMTRELYFSNAADVKSLTYYETQSFIWRWWALSILCEHYVCQGLEYNGWSFLCKRSQTGRLKFKKIYSFIHSFSNRV